MNPAVPSLRGGDEDGERAEASTFGEEQVRQLLAENTALERTLTELRLGLDAHAIVATTDRKGNILEVNDRFTEISKYSREELIGAPQSIVNSGVHPKSFFKTMWATIGRGQIWQGEICNRTKDGNKYWVATTIVPLLGDNGKPQRYLSIRTDVTQLRETERRVRRLAYFDNLTSMPNQSSMVKHLAETADSFGDEFQAYLTLSLEDLITINDAFGYDMGDQTLKGIARLFTRIAEESAAESSIGAVPDVVARVGSNVFGMHLTGLGRDSGAAERRIAELSARLTHLVNETVRSCLGNVIEADLRVGYVLYRGIDGLDGAQVFTRAEIARRRTFVTKMVGQPHAFDEQMILDTQDRVNLIFDLRRGVECGDLRLYMQPIVGPDGEVLGFEGLLRWEDPTRGLVRPDQFIPLAESTGMIVEIGAWVLDEACRTLAEWAEHAHT
ncbi:MAG: EAL domain-containing protein, partial [Actinobacteria bacterium]|nr:EAL domain-containing protein [Actinomycetota bacterium]